MGRAALSLDRAMSRAVAEVLTGSHAPLSARAATRAIAVAKAQRWLGLDVFRFFAVLMMVQGHVFTTLLDDATKTQGWYPHHAAFHGYTAPMFLFGAGLAFGYTTFKKWDAHVAGGASAWKRYNRYIWLLVLGYGLQLPTLSLPALLSMEDPSRIARFFSINVLQHIGVSLAIAQVLVKVTKRKKVFVTALAGLAVLCVAAAPWIWALDVSGLPVVLQGYVNAAGHHSVDANGVASVVGRSYFPLVPWAGFTYAGIIIAYLVGLGGSAKSISERAAWPFSILALVFMLVPVVIDRFGPFPWPEHNFWKTNPLFFFWRLGNILLILAALCHAERFARSRGWLDPEAGSRLARLVLPWVKLIAAESLVIYVAHLLVLHGSVLAPGITRSDTFASHGHGLAIATLVAVAITAIMVVVSKAWAELRKQKRAYLFVRTTMIAAIVLLALTR